MNDNNAVRLIGSAMIWVGVAGLSYLFHSMGIFTAGGAFGMVTAGLILTAALWKAVK